MIPRTLHTIIENRLFKGKAMLLFGARQCGKSTLIETILEGKDHLYLNGDDADVRNILTDTTATNLKTVVGNKTILFIYLPLLSSTAIFLTLDFFDDFVSLNLCGSHILHSLILLFPEEIR